MSENASELDNAGDDVGQDDPVSDEEVPVGLMALQDSDPDVIKHSRDAEDGDQL